MEGPNCKEEDALGKKLENPLKKYLTEQTLAYIINTA